MIALQAIQPEPEPETEPQSRQAERSRTATRRRLRRAGRRGYLAFVRIGGVALLVALPLILYVMLTANLTSLTYKLARVQAQKTALLAQTMRQEDRIAKLESRERLATLAARLHMHDPASYVVVTLPDPARAPAPVRGIALLGAVDQWLNAAAGAAGSH